MSDDDLKCGDVGGTTADGTPCKNPAKNGGQCPIHTGESDVGRPSHDPTPLAKNFVESATLAGIPHDVISDALGISKHTLYKHYRQTLDNALARANAKVANTLFQMATSGKNTSATIFWMKTKMGWSTKRQVDITTDGKSLTDPLAGLTKDEKRKALKKRLRQLEAIDGTPDDLKGLPGDE